MLHPTVQKQICRLCLHEVCSFLYEQPCPRNSRDHWPPQPRSIFANVFKLLPAHYLVADAKGIQSERYWSPPFDQVEVMDEVEAGQELDRILRETVPLHMIADVHGGAVNDSRFVTRMKGEGNMAEMIKQQFHLYTKQFHLNEEKFTFNLNDFVRLKPGQLRLF